MNIRVTQNAVVKQYNRNMNKTLSQMNKLNNQVTSGRKFLRASENSLGAARAIAVRKSLSNLDTYEDNLTTAKGIFSTAESSLMTVTTQMTDVTTKLISGATAGKSQEDMNAIATDIEGIAKNMVKDMNLEYADRNLFGGANNSTKAFSYNEKTGQVTFNGENVNTGAATKNDSGVTLTQGLVIAGTDGKYYSSRTEITGANITDATTDVVINALDPTKVHSVDISELDYTTTPGQVLLGTPSVDIKSKIDSGNIVVYSAANPIQTIEGKKYAYSPELSAVTITDKTTPADYASKLGTSTVQAPLYIDAKNVTTDGAVKTITLTRPSPYTYDVQANVDSGRVIPSNLITTKDGKTYAANSPLDTNDILTKDITKSKLNDMLAFSPAKTLYIDALCVTTNAAGHQIISNYENPSVDIDITEAQAAAGAIGNIVVSTALVKGNDDRTYLNPTDVTGKVITNEISPDELSAKLAAVPVTNYYIDNVRIGKQYSVTSTASVVTDISANVKSGQVVPCAPGDLDMTGAPAVILYGGVDVTADVRNKDTLTQAELDANPTKRYYINDTELTVPNGRYTLTNNEAHTTKIDITADITAGKIVVSDKLVTTANGKVYNKLSQITEAQADKLNYTNFKGTDPILIDVGIGIEFDADGVVDPSTAMDISLNGAQLLGCGVDGDGDSKNIIQLTFDAAKALRDGDSGKAKNLIDKINKAKSTLLNGITNLGVMESSVEYNLDSIETQRANLDEAQVSAEGMSVEEQAAAITDYKLVQAAYNATLQMGAKVVPTSLFDFIN